jgi:hypothetical protein
MTPKEAYEAALGVYAKTGRLEDHETVLAAFDVYAQDFLESRPEIWAAIKQLMEDWIWEQEYEDMFLKIKPPLWPAIIPDKNGTASVGP